MMSRRLRPGSSFTKMSISLSGRASPRAREPKTRTSRAPWLAAMRNISSRLSCRTWSISIDQRRRRYPRAAERLWLEQLATCRLVHKLGGVFGQQQMRVLQLTHHFFDPLDVGLAIAVALLQRRTRIPVRQALCLGLGQGHIRALAIAQLALRIGGLVEIPSRMGGQWHGDGR